MSAVVCGKRSFLYDLHGSTPTAKRVRCGGSSPVSFSSPTRSSSPGLSDPGNLGTLAVEVLDRLLQLRSLFPGMEEQVVEKVLESCGNNLESAIKRLSDLCLSSTIDSQPSSESAGSLPTSDSVQPSTSRATILEPTLHIATLPIGVDGTQWVDHLVQEMLHASDLDDARRRATKALEAFEKTLSGRGGLVLEALQKENSSLKEQLQIMLRDNQILKRAVTIQHERQLDHAAKLQELQQLKQLITQYQEQVHTLEINNYALTLHLRKAQEGSSIPGRFHPDIF